jgi:hypothetical protein
MAADLVVAVTGGCAIPIAGALQNGVFSVLFLDV